MASMDSEGFEWHGWGLSDSSIPSLHVGHLPGRKSLALYVTDTSVIRTLAYFRDEESAKEALKVLDRLVFATRYGY